MLLVNCPKCAAKLQIPDELLGKIVACSACQTRIQLQAPAPTRPTPIPTPQPEKKPAPAMPQLSLDEEPTTKKPLPQKVEEPPVLSVDDLFDDEVRAKKPARNKVDDIPTLSDDDLLEEDPPARRQEKQPAHRPQPEPSSSDDPFAFGGPAAQRDPQTDDTDNSDDTPKRVRGGANELAPARHASNALYLVAVIDALLAIGGSFLAMVARVQIVGGLALPIGLLVYGANQLSEYRNKPAIYIAVGITFIVGSIFFLFPLGILVMLLCFPENRAASAFGTVGGMLLVGAPFGLFHLYAGFRVIWAMNVKAVKDAFYRRAQPRSLRDPRRDLEFPDRDGDRRRDRDRDDDKDNRRKGRYRDDGDDDDRPRRRRRED